MIGATSMNGSGISDVTPPTSGSPMKVKYTPPPPFTVKGPALAPGYENTNRGIEITVGPDSGSITYGGHSQPVTKVDEILAERGQRYGTFKDHAAIAQILKTDIDLFLNARNKRLQPDQKQALDVICDKIARIINGDPDYIDNWDDIAGYATLVSKRLQEDLNGRGS